MIANQMRINQLGLAATAWYLGFLEAVEAKDIGRFAGYLADDIDMRINDAPSIAGKDAVVEQLRAEWRCFRSINHELLNILGDDAGFVSESLHHYDRHDGTQVTTRAAVFTERGIDGTVASIRIYSDALPVPAGLPDVRSGGDRMTTSRSITPLSAFLSCLLAMALTGCSFQMPGLFGGQTASGDEAAVQPSLPSYAKGSWYAFNDGSREVVVDIVGDTVTWQDEKGRLETRYRNPILPRLKWPEGETSLLAEPDLLWPLASGNIARFYEVRSEFDFLGRLTQRKERVWRCRVRERAVIDTDAGSFEAYPISCELRSRGGADRLLGTRLWHYAPEVGHYVRYEKVDGTGTREIRELIARG